MLVFKRDLRKAGSGACAHPGKNPSAFLCSRNLVDHRVENGFFLLVVRTSHSQQTGIFFGRVEVVLRHSIRDGV